MISDMGCLKDTVLGPILFLIYINNLNLALKNSQVTMYAEDTSTYSSSRSVNDIKGAVYADLQDLKIWLGSNKLSLNVLKHRYHS